MPVLSSTPDITAETWLGAAAWAPGSQKWSGTRPALRPNPTSASSASHEAAAPLERSPLQAEKSKLPRALPTAAKKAKMAKVPAWAAAR